jgi:hypothetical protein
MIAYRKPSLLMLHFILTFWIFIVSGDVFSLPFSYSLCADKLSNSVMKTVTRLNPNESQQDKSFIIIYFYRSLSTWKFIISFIKIGNQIPQKITAGLFQYVAIQRIWKTASLTSVLLELG